MDEEHTINALAYVETNPVRAGMISRARDYPWSSAPAHVTGKPDQLLDLRRWFSRFDNKEWEQTLDEYHGRRAMSDTIRRYTRKGAPLGRDRAFLNAVTAWRQGMPRD
jgi:putative transposase